MNTIKSLGFVGLAAAGLFAAQAFATTCPTTSTDPHLVTNTQGSPTCIASYGQDGNGTGLNQLYGPGGSQITGTGLNIYHGQYVPSSYWQIGGTGGSFNVILAEIAGNANANTFGIFDPSNPGNRLQLFSGPDGPGAKGTLVYNGGGNFQFALFGQSATSATFGDGASFGYYLGTPVTNADGSLGTLYFFSDPSLNNSAGEAGNPYSDGMHHMVAYQGGNGTKINATGGDLLSNEFLLGWEDQAFQHSDLDYNDFVVLVESVHSVPEPAVLGMFGLGVLLLGGFAALRRRGWKA
ncbi:MAG TPA: DUF4114 domain-containing protein [Pseudomonas sp.]|nr:DUF4114 domain-containing protein [Pseudomonas sp.]